MNKFLRVVGIVTFVVLILLYTIYQVVLSLSSKVELETVVSHTAYNSIDVKGIAIRSEEILTSNANGYVYYTLEDGARVAKDGTIAMVYPSETDALNTLQINDLSNEISNLQTLQMQGSISKTNLETLNEQIEQKQEEMMYHISSGEYQLASGYREELTELLNRKLLLTTGEFDFSAKIKQLQGQQSTLESSSHKAATGVVISPTAGYFVSALDGFEDVVDYNKVSSLTVAKVNDLINKKPEIKTQGNQVGKVVGNYEWYIACVVPTEKLTNITEGASLSVRLPFVSDEDIPVTVTVINHEKDQSMVLMKCSYMSESLSSIRVEEIQIVLNEYTGLYVPDSALRFEKDTNAPGVFVCSGTTLEFKYVNILYHSPAGKYNICDADPTNKNSIVAAAKKTDSDSSMDEDTSEEIEPEETMETSTEETPRTFKQYLALYDEIVIGGKNLYEGKIVR